MKNKQYYNLYFFIFILPLLSGCFMYNNVKQGFECSFDNTKCLDHETEQNIEQIQKATQAAESLLHTRCAMLGLKQGTNGYIDCRTKHDRIYNEDANAYGAVRAYILLQANYQSWQVTCEKYGTKTNTSAYNRCFDKQEEAYINQRKEDYEFQKALALRPVINTYTSVHTTSKNATTFY